MRGAHTTTTDRPTEIDEGLWVVVSADSHRVGAAEQLREACLHALDRGAEHLAVDVTASRTLSAELKDVLASASDVLRARGGSLVIWAREHGSRDPIVLSVDDKDNEGVEAVAARLRVTTREERS